MSASSDWLYPFVYLVGASLVAAVYVAGIVVTLRRWHLGVAPRLAAAGFGILLFEAVAGQVFNVVRPLLFGNDVSNTMAQFAVFQSAMTLLSVSAFTLIVLSIRTALRDLERARHVAPTSQVWLSDEEPAR